jgi:hypothetical protein
LAPEQETRMPRSLGPLYDLIREGFPELEHPDGSLDVAAAAETLGVTRQHLYSVFRSGSCPGALASRLIFASNGRITPEDLLPHLPESFRQSIGR